jgi:hypothetical protein
VPVLGDAKELGSMSQWRYLDVVILLVIGCIAMYAVPALIDGYRKLRRAREFYGAERRKLDNLARWHHNEHGSES